MRSAAVRAFGVFVILLATGIVAGAETVIAAAFAANDETVVLTTILTALLAIAVIACAGVLLIRGAQRLARLLAVSVAVIACAGLLAWPVAWDGRLALADLRPKEREAFEILRTAESFDSVAVGFLAVPSNGYLAMRVLGRAPAADTAFKSLIRHGTPAGQIYGLIGVKRTDPAYFRRILPRYERSPLSVSSQFGCVGGSTPLAELAADIRAADYPRAYLDRLPGETQPPEPPRR